VRYAYLAKLREQFNMEWAFCSYVRKKKVVLISIVLIVIMQYPKAGPNEPPIVPYLVPFLGSALHVALSPIEFYKNLRKKVRR
jgi:hypothetical protein